MFQNPLNCSKELKPPKAEARSRKFESLELEELHETEVENPIENPARQSFAEGS